MVGIRQEYNKQDVTLVIFVLFISGVFSFMIPLDREFIKSAALKYLGSAILQSFAALIAIPFAFYASYLHHKYGSAGLQFAISRVKEVIFPSFAIVGLISIALIMFPNYPDIPNFSIPYELALKITLFAELVTSSILFIFIYRHLIEVMTVTPSKLVEKIIQLDQIHTDLLNSNLHHLRVFALRLMLRNTKSLNSCVMYLLCLTPVSLTK